MTPRYTVHLLQTATPRWWQRSQLPFKEADYAGYKPIAVDAWPSPGQVMEFPMCSKWGPNVIIGVALCADGNTFKLQLIDPTRVNIQIQPRLTWSV